jgi:alkanesulfonate monooxygenase SsuD/methylene tetrahydromethanopterin reductase-like flavin-dependent oxidoreductase (luciferase family)
MADSQRSAARTGIALRDPWSWRDLAELVATAEETGFAALFLPEITGREAFSTLSAVAGETTSLDLGTGIVTIVARRALTTAMAAATVDERSGGRLVLGLGSGPAGPGSLERLRDYARRVRALLDGSEARTESGRPMRLSMPPPPGRRIPIWVAALGPRAMRLAGELADGVLLNWCPPERVAFARDRVREGAEAAGRDPEAVTVAVYVRACVGQDEEEAMSSLRRAAAEYTSIPVYLRQFEAVGLGAEARAAAAAHREARPEDVPDSLVRTVALVGSASEAKARLEAYRQAGADLPIVYPVPCLDPRSSVLGTLFATAPHPALAS